MLGSAWDWLVGLLATSPDGASSILRAHGSPKGGSTWMDGDWDEADESAMVECILAEDDGAYLDSLLMLPEEEASNMPSVSGSHGTLKRGPPVTENRRGLWTGSSRVHQNSDATTSSASSWQSMGFVTASGVKAPEEIPPPPLLEVNRTPSPPRTKSVKQSLNDVVCQTSREEEEADLPWQGADDARAARESSTPVSVFEGFSPSGKDCLLPPQRPEDKGKRTLVLDLDETLVHSVFQPVPTAHFTLKVQLEQGPLDVYVLKRPGVDKFLEAMASHYEVVVFTASVREYADPLLDILDPQGLISHRLFRDACSNSRNGYVKDLTRLGRNLADTIIIDNSPHAYAFQPDNALPILSFYEDATDSELQKISPFLESLGSIPGDVRQLLTAALGAKVKSLLQTRLSFLL